MKTVEELCAAYLEADARYKGLCMMNRATGPKERVAQDLEIRTAMRAMLKAEREYTDALDGVTAYLAAE